jgi:hypothetical protein
LAHHTEPGLAHANTLSTHMHDHAAFVSCAGTHLCLTSSQHKMVPPRPFRSARPDSSRIRTFECGSRCTLLSVREAASRPARYGALCRLAGRRETHSRLISTVYRPFSSSKLLAFPTWLFKSGRVTRPVTRTFCPTRAMSGLHSSDCRRRQLPGQPAAPHALPPPPVHVQGPRRCSRHAEVRARCPLSVGAALAVSTLLRPAALCTVAPARHVSQSSSPEAPPYLVR